MKKKMSASGGIIRETVYTPRHLKRYYPQAYRRALEWWKRVNQEDNFRAEEFHASLEGLFKTCGGVKMTDYSYGAYSQGSRVSVAFNQDGAGELRGARALAWLENNLLAHCRAPWGLNKNDGNLHENGDNGKRGRAYRKVWRRWYAPGSVRACPFTGVCYDADIIAELYRAVKAGDTLEEAFRGLGDFGRRTLEQEYEYDVSDEAFFDAADANGYTFTRDGARAW